MKYLIYEKREKANEIFHCEYTLINNQGHKKADVDFIKSGKIELNNLQHSSWHPCLNNIPEENQKELSEKGKTVYTILTKTTIILEN